MLGLSGYKDTDREILLALSDEDLLTMCCLNKYFYSLCDDNFFHLKLSKSYPDTLLFTKGKTYKQHYIEVVHYITQLYGETGYSYLQGNVKRQYYIFHNCTDNQELLYRATRLGDIEIVREAVERGADISADSECALKEACENGHLEVVKYLKELGANVHINNDMPLYRAMEYDHIEIVKYLREVGVNISADNECALRWASANGYMSAVKYLVENGADISANDDTALNWSIENGRLEIVKYLVENGVNIHRNDDDAIKIASYWGHYEIVEYFLSILTKGLLINRANIYNDALNLAKIGKDLYGQGFENDNYSKIIKCLNDHLIDL